MPACAHHPERAAVTVCIDCLAAICEACFRCEDGRELCPTCAAKRRRGRWVRRAVAALALLAVAAGAVAVGLSLKRSLRYGKASAKVHELRGRLERTPCDARAAIELGDTLIRADASDEVEPMAAAFAAACGRQEELLWRVYEAAKQTGQWKRALEVATDLIEHRPSDKDYWWWRGVVREQLGDLELALADYKQAIAIRPDLTNIPFNVASLYERMKRPCDAALAIEQFVHWHPDAAAEDEVRMRLDRLYREGRCGESVRGTAVIRFPPGQPVIAAEAVVNGRPGRFLVDTGATLVVLRRGFAERLGVPTSAGAELEVATVNGIAKAHLVRLEGMSLGGASASGVEAAVVDDLAGGYDGLVGLSFLSRFEMRLDAAAGRLELGARGR